MATPKDLIPADLVPVEQGAQQPQAPSDLIPADLVPAEEAQPATKAPSPSQVLQAPNTAPLAGSGPLGFSPAQLQEQTTGEQRPPLFQAFDAAVKEGEQLQAGGDENPGVRALRAAAKGVSNTIPARLVRGGLRQAGQDELADALTVDFNAQNALEGGIELGATFTDPAFGPVAGLANKTVGAVTQATRIARLAPLTDALAKGGTAGAAGGFLFEGARQLDEKDFSAGNLALSTGIGAFGGAITARAFTGIERKLRLRMANMARKMREFDLPDAPLFERIKYNPETDARQAWGVFQKIERTEKQILRASQALQKAAPGQREKQLDKVLALRAEKGQLAQQFEDLYGGPVFRALKAAKKAVGDSGKLKQSFTKTGVVLNADVIEALNSGAIKDVSFDLVTDLPRLLESAQGSLRGILTRSILEPANKANINARVELEKIMSRFADLANRAGLSGNPTGKQAALSKKLFDVAEGRANVKELNKAQRSLYFYTRNMYKSMIDDINRVRVSNNLKPIAERKNYMPHMREIRDALEFGIDPTTHVSGSLKEVTSRFFKERHGDEFVNDFVGAFSSYTKAAMRVKHMTPVKQQLEALYEFMPQKNLRRVLAQFSNGPAFGGRTFSDAVLQNASPYLYNKINQWNTLMGNSKLGLSLNLVADQPSQVAASGAFNGYGNMMRGIKHMIADKGQEAYRRLSRQGELRAASEEFRDLIRGELAKKGPISTTINQALKWHGKVVDFTDQRVFSQSWYSAFYQGINRFHLTEEGAAKYADTIASKIHAVYSDIYRPRLIQGAIGKAIFPFATWSFNLFNMLTRDPALLSRMAGGGKLSRAAQFSKVAEILGGMWATNQVYEMAGLRQPIEFVSMEGLQKAAGVGRDRQTGELEFDPFEHFQAPRVGPFSLANNRGLVNNFLPSQVASDTTKAAQSLFRRVMDPDSDRDETWADFFAGKEAKALSNFVPGGAQIYRTIKAHRDLERGYTELGGTEVPLDEEDRLPGLAFGVSNTPSVKDFRRRGF